MQLQRIKRKSNQAQHHREKTYAEPQHFLSSVWKLDSGPSLNCNYQLNSTESIDYKVPSPCIFITFFMQEPESTVQPIQQQLLWSQQVSSQPKGCGKPVQREVEMPQVTQRQGWEQNVYNYYKNADSWLQGTLPPAVLSFWFCVVNIHAFGIIYREGTGEQELKIQVASCYFRKWGRQWRFLFMHTGSSKGVSSCFLTFIFSPKAVN